MDQSVTYRFAPGFSCRREAFGGILFHYAGRTPDPGISFVESAFLIDLLQMVDQAPLGQLLAEAGEEFGLDAPQTDVLHQFCHDLVAREALVPK